MLYRTLGRTGLRVSVIGVGTWQFGGEWGRDYTEADVAAILGAAQDAGLNLIDTAECYGDHLSERLIGATLPGRREDWIIATKFGHRFHEPFQRDNDWTPAGVVAQLEASLRALRTDYVDLYQFHSGPDSAFETEGLWEVLRAEQARGKIRHLGVSIGANTNVQQAERGAAVGAAAIQVVYNRLQREPEAAVLPACQRHHLGVLARVPLASGFLSGKYAPGATFGPRDMRSVWMTEARREQVIAEVRHIAATEVPPGVPLAQWALAWCLRHPAVTCVIPGCKSPEQVRDNAAAAALVADPRRHPQAA